MDGAFRFIFLVVKFNSSNAAKNVVLFIRNNKREQIPHNCKKNYYLGNSTLGSINGHIVDNK